MNIELEELTPVEKRQTSCVECPVRRIALFNGVAAIELDRYRTLQYKAKSRQIIMHEGKYSEHVYTLFHGALAMFKTLDNGKRQILHISLPGDLIGFQSDFAAPMSYSVMSLADSVLCAFSRERMPEMFRNNPNVVKRLNELNARDLGLCHSRMATMGQQSAAERIAYFCCELFYRHKAIHSDANSKQISFPLSQEDLGDATGLTKIHVNRTLRALREQGLMEISSRKLTVHDIDALLKLSGFDPHSIEIHSLF